MDTMTAFLSINYDEVKSITLAENVYYAKKIFKNYKFTDDNINLIDNRVFENVENGEYAKLIGLVSYHNKNCRLNLGLTGTGVFLFDLNKKNYQKKICKCFLDLLKFINKCGFSIMNFQLDISYPTKSNLSFNIEAKEMVNSWLVNKHFGNLNLNMLRQITTSNQVKEMLVSLQTLPEEIEIISKETIAFELINAISMEIDDDISDSFANK